MKTMHRLFFVLMAISLGLFGVMANLLAADSASSENKPPRPELRFHDGTFKILQLTDLHLAFQGIPDDKTEATFPIIDALLEKERPDLVVLTGDVVVLKPTALAGGLPEAWERLAEPFAKRQIPYAITFGNHDHEHRQTAAEMLAMIQTNPWNIVTSEDPSLPGAGNCVVPVLSADGACTRWNLWFFDSLAYPEAQGFGGYHWISFDQIAWYRKRSAELAAGNDSPLPALAFFHIPLPEYRNIHQKPDTLGDALEDVSAPELNSGFFTALLEQKEVMGVFVGHDHNNNYIGIYKNIALAFGQKTGTNSYQKLPLGGRVIILDEKDHAFKTYITTPDETFNNYEFRRDW